MDERINDLEFLHALLRSDFKSFAIKVFNEVSAGAQYLVNWHIDVVCNEIEQMISGDNNRLIVNIPPRNMKSIYYLFGGITSIFTGAESANTNYMCQLCGRTNQEICQRLSYSNGNRLVCEPVSMY